VRNALVGVVIVTRGPVSFEVGLAHLQQHASVLVQACDDVSTWHPWLLFHQRWSV